MQRVAGILASHNIKSALEAGTGEATKLAQLGQIAGPAIALSGFELVSPVNKRPLRKMGDYLYCRDESLLYPAPFGIPVMKEDCAVICSNADQV